MDVDASIRRNIKDPLRKNLAECHDDHEVRFHSFELLCEFFCLDFLWLKHGDVMRNSKRFHRGRRKSLPAAARLVRLRDDSDDIAGICEHREARNGEFRRAHEDDAKPLHDSAPLCTLSATSMKSCPSKWSHSCWMQRARSPVAVRCCFLP